MKCIICKNNNLVFKDDYIFDVQDDKQFFGDIKIYFCSNCQVSFAHPMPDEKKLDFYYENIYRSPFRPPYLLNNDYEDLKTQCLEDRFFNYLVYLTTLIDLKNVKKIYDFGAGNGDIGYLLKKKFPHLELYCTESDIQCKKLLAERGYINIENLNNINIKFDLIITLHSLEHLPNVSIFDKFLEILEEDGKIFFEVPNCTEEYFKLRAYDSPHLIFWTKRAFFKIAEIYNLNFINFSYTFYSFEYDRKFSLEAKQSYEKNFKSILPYLKIKNIIKKLIPKSIIKFRRDFLKLSRVNSEDRVNWFTNNTGNNCYIRGILEKKK